jgi:plasmid stabilization system protein ParE
VIVTWSPEGAADLQRLYAFVAGVDPNAAAQIAATLQSVPDKLLSFPRLGERLEAFELAEVRRLIVGKYEMRYEIISDEILILRIFHGREDRIFDKA